MRIIKLSYANEEAYLSRYLKGGIDPWDYQHRFWEYIAEEAGDEGHPDHGLFLQHIERDLDSVDSDEDDQAMAEQWMENASGDQKDRFIEWIDDNKGNYGYESPPYEALMHQEYRKASWLVHFTTKAVDIGRNGFQYGHPDIDGVHLTMWKQDRKQTGGYNYAFDAYDQMGLSDGVKYGSEFVVFWSSGVAAFHRGDGEDQIIFWGPSVRPDMIFPVVNDNNGWSVEDSSGRSMFMSQQIVPVVNWVMANWQMVQRAQKGRAAVQAPVQAPLKRIRMPVERSEDNEDDMGRVASGRSQRGLTGCRRTGRRGRWSGAG